jgi:tetrahydromethanopterin S-methyltransferase subunit G
MNTSQLEELEEDLQKQLAAVELRVRDQVGEAITIDCGSLCGRWLILVSWDLFLTKCNQSNRLENMSYVIISDDKLGNHK